MMPLCWFILLLCLSAHAGNNAVWRESGENVTLRCSSAECPSSNEEYDGMHLYLKQYHEEQKEVLYYHSYPESVDKITLGIAYTNRIQTHGSLKNHTITISQLTVDDSGFYSCVFIDFPRTVPCSVYTLFIRGVTPFSKSTEVPRAPTSEKSPPLVSIIIGACIISVLVTTIFILLIILSVKRWISSRRSVQQVQHPEDDFVYEVMTKNGPRPAQKQQSSRL